MQARGREDRGCRTQSRTRRRCSHRRTPRHRGPLPLGDRHHFGAERLRLQDETHLQRRKAQLAGAPARSGDASREAVTDVTDPQAPSIRDALLVEHPLKFVFRQWVLGAGLWAAKDVCGDVIKRPGPIGLRGHAHLVVPSGFDVWGVTLAGPRDGLCRPTVTYVGALLRTSRVFKVRRLTHSGSAAGSA